MLAGDNSLYVYIYEYWSRDYDLSLSDILHQLVASHFVYYVELYDHINSEKVSTFLVKKYFSSFRTKLIVILPVT